MAHTPVPWRLESDRKQYEVWGTAPSRRIAIVEKNNGDYASAIDNAHFIVRAANCHDELLEALKAMLGIDNPEQPDIGHVDYRRAVIMGYSAVDKATQP